jgi:hypothetical protein
MNKEQAMALDAELLALVRDWAKEKGLAVSAKPGKFDNVSDTFTVVLTEMASNGLPKQDAWDREVMQNWLKDTGWEGRDPRGHVFGTANHKKKFQGHWFRIENFKYGTRFPWKVTDLTTGEPISCNSDFIDWNNER